MTAPSAIDGMLFGKLRAVERAGSNAYGQAEWRCECDCGGEVVSTAASLKRGHIKSCGCLWRASFAETRICASCKVEKKHSEFSPGNSGHGLSAYCKDCKREKSLKRYRNNPAPYLARNRLARAILRDEVLRAYGEKCACCGEAQKMFLAIDHINNDGAAHRKELRGSGNNFYKWLKENDFPPGYQTLCANCNWGKYVNGGVCPHAIHG